MCCMLVAGQGKEHAKWSPVATAWYKLLPEIVITKVFFLIPFA